MDIDKIDLDYVMSVDFILGVKSNSMVKERLPIVAEQPNNALKLTERVCHGSCEAHEHMPALALQLNADVRLTSEI